MSGKAEGSCFGIAIVSASGLAHVLIVGLARCIGILNVILLDKFQESYAATAMVFSLFSGTRTVIGFIDED